MNRYEQFVMLCERMCSAEKFVINHRQREHNSAMSALERLKKKMYSEPEHSLSLASSLLQHDNEKVRCVAAVYCLEADICVEDAKETLLDIYRNSTDRIRSMNAYWTMMLTPRIW